MLHPKMRRRFNLRLLGLNPRMFSRMWITHMPHNTRLDALTIRQLAIISVQSTIRTQQHLCLGVHLCTRRSLLHSAWPIRLTHHRMFLCHQRLGLLPLVLFLPPTINKPFCHQRLGRPRVVLLLLPTISKPFCHQRLGRPRVRLCRPSHNKFQQLCMHLCLWRRSLSRLLLQQPPIHRRLPLMHQCYQHRGLPLLLCHRPPLNRQLCMNLCYHHLGLPIIMLLPMLCQQ